MLPDYHTHTLLCKHADGMPLDYVRAAAEKGIAEIAATDHCPTDDGYGIGHRMALAQFQIYSEWVAEAQASKQVKLLFGIEADYYPGCQQFLVPWEEKHAFDVIIGSVHFLDYWAPDSKKKGLSNAKHPDRVWRRYFELIGEMADTGLYDIVAHIDLPKKFGNPISDKKLRDYALPALDRIAASGMCIEINTAGLNHLPKECYPSPQFLTWAQERGIGLTFGSDAHQPERVGADFDVALKLAKDAGFTHRQQIEKRRKSAIPL